MIPGIVAGVSGATPYAGLLDLVPGAAFAHSQRAMAEAWVTTVISIKRASDSEEESYAPVASHAVNAPMIASFLDGTIPSGMALLDQTGNGRHVTQDTPIAAPGWGILPESTKPAVGMRAFDEALTSTSLFYADTPIPVSGATWLMVVYIDPDQAINCGGHLLSGSGSSKIEFIFTADYLSVLIKDQDANECEWFIEGIYSGLHVLEMHVSAAGAAKILVDGVDQEAEPLADPVAVAMSDLDTIDYVMARVDAGQGVRSVLYESIFYGSELSAPNRALLRDDQTGYYPE